MTNLDFDYLLVPAGTVVTGSGNGNSFELDDKDQYRSQVNVTAISGAGATLTFSVQTSHDNGATDPWRSVGSQPTVSATGATPWIGFDTLDRWIRGSWVVAGTTPSVTFGVAGEAV